MCTTPPYSGDWRFNLLHNLLGFSLRQFVKPQHLLQHLGNIETKEVHSIISPWVVGCIVFLFYSIFRENVLFPASVVLKEEQT